MSYANPKEEGGDGDPGEILDGTGMDDGGEYFCYLNARGLMTRKKRRTVLLFDIARFPLRAK